MTCPKCKGFCLVERTEDYGLVLTRMACINCAWRSMGRIMPDSNYRAFRPGSETSSNYAGKPGRRK